MASVWSMVEEEVNTPWQFGSGRPLYRCILVRLLDGYVVMNIYHHAAADGTSGMLVMGGIMKQYKLLEEGKEVVRKQHQPREAMEDLVDVKDEDTRKLVEEMVKGKIKRATEYKPYVPFDMDEFKANNESELPINKTLFRDGSQENYSAIRVRCREEGVTVGSLVLAASYMAMATLHARATCTDPEEYGGMKDEYIDIPVNVRRRLDPPIGDNYCGFYITEVTTRCDVDKDTTVWALAKVVGKQLNDMIAQDQHRIFAR